jgi:RimJ/RimL family protein N-acetyltransferase
MVLPGKMVKLRPLTLHDLGKMVEWNCDNELQNYVDCDLPTTLPELERWYTENVPDCHYQIYAIETNEGELIGDLELDHICWKRREAELRIRIGEKRYWGHGLGGDTIEVILEYLMTVQNFNRLYLRVYDFNERAIRCYLRNGFRQVGVLHRRVEGWKNIILMRFIVIVIIDG